MRRTLQAQKELKKKYYELYNHSKTAKYYNQLDEDSFEDSQTETEAESEYVNDATPGPGSYITGKLASTFSTKKPKSKQYFGSKVVRFAPERYKKKYRNGPGLYKLRTTMRQKDVTLLNTYYFTSNRKDTRKSLSTLQCQEEGKPDFSLDQVLVRIIRSIRYRIK